MPIIFTGPVCARRGCGRPIWKDELCNPCWRLAYMFGKDPRLFAYHPLDGYADDRDAMPLPWERLEQEAQATGLTLAEALARAPRTEPR